MSPYTALFATFLLLTVKRPTLLHVTKSQTSRDKTWNMLWFAHKHTDSHQAFILILSSRILRIATSTVKRLDFNPLKPNEHYTGRTAPRNSKRCILYIYSTNIGTEYFQNSIYSPFFSLQNAVCFIILTYLVPVFFTFYIQGVLKLKKNNSGPKRSIIQNKKNASRSKNATSFKPSRTSNNLNYTKRSNYTRTTKEEMEGPNSS